MLNNKKYKSLDDIFKDADFHLIEEHKKISSARNADERLYTSFQEINDFIALSGHEPEPNIANIAEFQLYSRLKNIKEDPEKVEILKPHDIHNILDGVASNIANEPNAKYNKTNQPTSIDDILNSNTFGIFDDDEPNLFDFKHTPKEYDRASAEFVARRKPCKDFEKYAPLFKEIQKDLAAKKRKLIDFAQRNLVEGSYYVHNGVLFLLENINITQKEHYKPDGTRVREDGRTRCIFENGTESNMLKRSVEKILYANGKVVTDNLKKINENFTESFSSITDEDKEAGYIYLLKSKSADNRISSIQNLYKIGYSKTAVAERIKNAEKEPTYLMAPVDYVAGWKCYNMNPQKFEQLIHNFFGNSCLEIDVFDDKGRRHTPREWFIAPIEVIEQTIELIINGKVVNYKYDAENMTIIKR
jgi:hypothetical protein